MENYRTGVGWGALRVDCAGKKKAGTGEGGGFGGGAGGKQYRSSVR